MRPSCGLLLLLTVVQLHSTGEISGQMPRIEVDPQRMTALREHASGRPFVPVGLNYFAPDIGWPPRPWQRFEESRVREHLRLIREHGFNTVRVFLTLASFHVQPGQPTPEGLDRLRTLLALCREAGIYVIIAGPDHWEGVPAWRTGRDMFADEEILAADEAWWTAFAAAFRDEPALLAIDLHNEPTIGWDTPAMRPLWHEWLRRRYHTAARLAESWGPEAPLADFDGIAAPPPAPARGDPRLADYQRFRESLGHRWTQRMVAAIRRADPRRPVTIGHVQWACPVLLPGVAHYPGFEPRDNAALLDFVTVHFYPLAEPMPAAEGEGIFANRFYLEIVLREVGAGKPLMLGEFGWYGAEDPAGWGDFSMPPRSWPDQLAWGEALLETTAGRVCGWLHWAFADTPASTDLTRWSGLWTADLRIKPWGRRYAGFAARAAHHPEQDRPWSDDTGIAPEDRRLMLTDPAVGAEWRARRLAERRTR